MNVGGLIKSMILNLVGAFIVTVMLWFFIGTMGNEYLPYLAALVGMYIFACFGVDRIIDDEIIPNDYSRFILAIFCIIIYAVAFLYVMPVIFGAGVFPAGLELSSSIVLDTKLILAICGVIVLVLNYFDYK
ncbi:MAG: hypothetical protein IJL02_01690 [Methanobrevibacter sp.]|uniref:hypothetical protein n=1 Tax=Methanobrevibacter sp. TaxID=66852 RepID=UPI0025FAD207|nr:hypothetical protein [Methanobrevibacter sp.]MBQ6098559.1 hypothetical protein [Methanobrevibacter sp.]